MEKSKIAPHVCPQCGSAAYIGAFDLECTGPKCDHYHAETAAAYTAERFPSVDSIENEDTQPDYIRVKIDGEPTIPAPAGSFRWPSVAPAAVFPDTDEELAQQIRDGVDEALKDATPAEAAELIRWRDQILEDYLAGFTENVEAYAPLGAEAFLLRAKIYLYCQRAFEEMAALAERITTPEAQELNKWARIWGCDRRPGETDEDLRKRIQGASMFSPGSSL